MIESLQPCASVRMNVEISERARMLGFGMKILGFPAQSKFVSSGCHTHSNAHNRP